MNNDFGIATITKECLEQLSLDQNPFTEHAGDTYIYSDRQTEMTTNVILDNLQNTNSTVVICGDQGIGKTTYLRKLLRKGYQRYQFCTLRAKTNMSFQDICDKIAQRWIIHTSDNSSNAVNTENIEDYVVVYLGEHNHGVIIIDDADRLGIEVINELLTLKHRVGLAVPGRLGLVVTGKNSLILSLSELEGMNPAASQVYQVNIRPFNKEQTVNYVLFRLRTAGSNDAPALNEEEIEGIHDASRGVAREIHRLAISALRSKCSEQGTNIFSEPESETVEEKNSYLKPALLFGLPILVAAAVFLFRQGEEIPVQDKIPLTLPEQIVAQEPITSPEKRIDITLPSASSKSDDPVQSEITPANTEDQTVEDTVTLAPAESTSVPETSEESVERTSSITTNTETPVSEPEVSSVAEAAKTPVTKIEPLDVEPETTEETAPVVPEKVEIATPTHGVEWLKQLDSSHFTLQILASAEQKPLTALVKKHKLVDEYAIFAKTVKGKRWYVLVAGDFVSRQAATAAISKLPAELQKAKPWPVSINTVLKQL